MRAAMLEEGRIKASLGDATFDKNSRAAALSQVRRNIKSELAQEGMFVTPSEMQLAMHPLEKRAIQDLSFEGRRCDGRQLTQVRPLYAEVATLPVVHGSALFERGETQGLAVCTIGPAEDAAKSDGVAGAETKPFMVHYGFPSYSVNETGRFSAPSRREIGHSAVAEKGLAAIVPGADAFPFVIRLNCETLGSSGSSSMAAVCAGSLAMADAGVPIIRH
eukprot:CAMPEP_0182853366 /NCGR_PEP_ID=MMETSP0034_2-20130328/665_1 /TAXON_ID=156128 /ORGANISM="Nephroselmis pyriformis, Strain CCMP717" /LENGTH=218 /DNA_ID=CAMNT_0024984135 /DNA_START=60 /DNA_END=713 /DNA_ORIENTATION=+